ncbi:MAG: hypothetical protein M0R00_08995 [Candidatus Omnitrophica bacterium]|jgi:hypothetical protein|nr:hypothetical protein [Candidatus Omnitrophota bacterium]
MGKYRKKPVVVDAFQLGEYSDIRPCWLKRGEVCDGTGRHPFYYIQTLEGEMQGLPGDWVITGVKGEHYFCKDDIFKMTYEKVE